MHKRSTPTQQARTNLKAELDAKFSNSKRAKDALDDFDIYVDSYAQLGHQWVTGWRNVNVPLPMMVVSEFSVGGRVMRIDLSTDGYAAWIFSVKNFDWDNDPRFPLLQLAVANDLGADVEEVTTGVYSFEDGQHHALPFAHDQVELALADLVSLLESLR